ncbi:topoisomerase II [Methylobacterium sp. GXS13]|jgi:hypothetical protein|uniref:DUF4864 domain-containing protein n=1 Tax=unclassified Methylobacterium TaxID=2615210 RepID=UPI00071B0F9A|nr:MULTISPECIES: DUF4864 domain-containing protein [unclassified Methylobacterium]KST56983.1 topoisomerase II [Methylobacterium sp. GXS13]MCJ2120541.1 DUF4864 domain-containing protein [Methylobacterium sp. J-001]
MRVWLALLLILGLAGPALADDGARAAARAVITKQVEALGRDDASTAYAQAAPAIQELFPNADLFIGMVRNQYRPVYRHRSFVFGEGRDTGEAGVMQSVAIQDEYGVDWTAEYSLARDADGSWRITGCRLIKAPGTSA